MADTFTSLQVCEATGASYRQLDSWLRSQYLDIPNSAPGSGFPREFTFKDALQVAVMVKLTNTGIRPQLVHPARVVRAGGVYQNSAAVVTLDMAQVENDLRGKLGIKTDGVLA